jgi:hypothetical protein
MYPLHTNQHQLSQETVDFVLSRDFGAAASADASKLRQIADQSYDLLSRISKTEKLRRLGQLGKNGEAEFDANVRLVGMMMHLLQSYGYDDAEMMNSLQKKYHQIAGGISGKIA